MVLVTGAAGHLGGALVRELLSQGQKVRVFVLPNEDLSSLNGMPLEVVKGNVLDRCAVRAAVDGVEVVYHLAGIISIMPGRDEAMRQVNVVGTGNIARIAREAGVRRLVYVSSIHALARPAEGTAIDEQVLFDPHSAAGEYDQTKAEASLAVLAETAKGLDAVLVCPTGIIGPYYFRGGSPMNNQVRVWMKPGWHVVINGHFDFVDVRDVARGITLAAARGAKGQTYILRGERASVAELIAMVRRETGHRGGTVPVPFWLALLGASFAPLHARLWKKTVKFTRYALETLASNSVISGQKARRELGYTPRPLKETVRDTVRWLSENPEPVRRAAPAAGLAVRPAPAAPARRRTRVAVVTGASSGIGAVVARRLAARGFMTLLVARRAELLESLAAAIRASGGEAEALAVDLAQADGVRKVYNRVLDIGEGLDVLVNSAGVGWIGYASDMPPEAALQMVQVNNAALAQLIVLFLPMMRGRGRGHIINVSSTAGGFPSPWAALYSATKSFVDTLTTALHRELRGSGVHVSAVRPAPGRAELPAAVADAIIGLLGRPRRALYVPGRLRILPWVELGFGWLIDRAAGVLLRRPALQG